MTSLRGTICKKQFRQWQTLVPKRNWVKMTCLIKAIHLDQNSKMILLRDYLTDQEGVMNLKSRSLVSIINNKS